MRYPFKCPPQRSSRGRRGKIHSKHIPQTAVQDPNIPRVVPSFQPANFRMLTLQPQSARQRTRECISGYTCGCASREHPSHAPLPPLASCTHPSPARSTRNTWLHHARVSTTCYAFVQTYTVTTFTSPAAPSRPTNEQTKPQTSPRARDKEAAATTSPRLRSGTEMSRAKGPPKPGGPGSRGGKGGKAAGTKGEADKSDPAKPKKARSAYNFYLLKRIAQVRAGWFACRCCCGVSLGFECILGWGSSSFCELVRVCLLSSSSRGTDRGVRFF